LARTNLRAKFGPQIHARTALAQHHLRHQELRKLPDADKEGLNERKALALMLAQPSMIKRPVLELGGKLLVGFKPEIYAKEVAPSGKPARKT
jgi:arsenate reductase-like glutaredoxin family protein